MLLYHKIRHVQEGMRRQHFANFLIIVLVGQHCLCMCVCVCVCVCGIALVTMINFWLGEVEVFLSSPPCPVPFP